VVSTRRSSSSASSPSTSGRHGWLYSENDDLYDVERALVPEDVFAWLQETQKTFEKFIKPGSPDEDKRRRMLLDRLVASLDKPMTDREGALRTLRKGFNVAGLGAGSAKFDMMQAKPETSLNPSTQAGTRRTGYG
jgi:type I restriction enzyme R subunit